MVTLRIHLSPTIEVEVTGETENDCIKQAAFWTQLPTECPECGAPLTLSYRTPKGYEYYGLRCIGPVPHEKTFGIHKDTHGLFYKEREPFEVARMGQQTDEDGWPAEEPEYAPEPPRQQRGNGGGGNGRNGTALKTVGQQARQQAAPTPEAGGAAPVCDVCGKGLTLGQINYSTNKFGVPLCPAHQS